MPYGVSLPGVTWNKALHASVHVGPDLPPLLRPYASVPHTYARWVENDFNGTPPPPDPAVAPKTPRQIQIDGAKAIARAAAKGARGFLLADAPGVGKTITAVLAAKAAARIRAGSRVLVIADRPAAITIRHWSDTIRAVGDGDLSWLVVTYDQLGSLMTPTGGLRWRFDVIVNDEAQSMRHQDTKRTMTFWKVARYQAPHGDAPFVLHMTATPGHTPAEATYLAPVLAQAHGEPTRQWEKFPDRLATLGFPLAKGAYGKWGWDEETAADPHAQVREADRFTNLLRSHRPPLHLRRDAPWGPVPLEGLGVDLDYTARASYDSDWVDFRREMDIARRGSDASRGRAAVLRLRQKAGMVRVPQTVEWVQAQIEAGKQVAVSCEFVETAARPIYDALRERDVPVAGIFGRDLFDVEAERQRFQRGQARVVVFTPTASISLHAGERLADGTVGSACPRVGLFHQARYSGIAAEQIAGRTHRDGQVSEWFLAYATGTVEERVADVMLGRLLSSGATAGAEKGSLARIARLLGAEWLPEAALAGE